MLLARKPDAPNRQRGKQKLPPAAKQLIICMLKHFYTLNTGYKQYYGQQAQHLKAIAK